MKTGKGRSRFFDPSPPQEKQRAAVNNWNSWDDKTFPKGGMNIKKEPSFPAARIHQNPTRFCDDPGKRERCKFAQFRDSFVPLAPAIRASLLP